MPSADARYPTASPRPTPSVLHVVHHTKNVGNGIVNATVDLAISQASLGWDVAVATKGGDLDELLSRHNVALHKLDACELGRLPATMVAVRNAIATASPDVVHTHTTAALLGAKASVNKLALSPRPALISTMHNSFDIKTNVMASADAVIAISAAVQAQLRNRPWFKADRIHVVSNGPLLSPRMSRQSLENPSLSRPAVICVAGLYERKGLRELLHAFRAAQRTAPDWHLYIVGEGPFRRTLERTISDLEQTESVHLLGFRPDVAALLAHSDLFVLPSWVEGFGLAVVEARAARLPIIATAVGGIPEALDFGEAGLLVPPRDPDSLATTMVRLMTDEQLRRHFQGAAGKGLERFTTLGNAAATIEIYNAILRKREALHRSNRRRLEGFRRRGSTAHIKH